MSDKVKGTENTKKAIRHRSERELTEKSKRKKKNRRKMQRNVVIVDVMID